MDVNVEDADGNPLLYHAIQHPRGLNIVDSLIRGGADASSRDVEGNPLLYHAILLPRGYNIVRSLIVGGADVNARDSNGKTLLHTALERDDYNILNALVDAGAQAQ